MANRIKLKGTTESTFDIGLSPKQTFDASALTANRVWVLPDSNGVAGYVLSTDGAGVLSWIAVGAAQDQTTPYFIPDGDVFTNNLYRQNLFATSIDIEGILVVDGILEEVD